MRLNSLGTYLRQFPVLTGLRFYVADLTRAVLDPYSRVTYAQWGEDLTLHAVLGNKTAGFYVEVGANHPQRFSNVFSLYRRGWRGISIEANESFVQAHRRLRVKDHIVCAVVSNEERLVTFTEFEESLVSSLDAAFVDQMLAGGKKISRQRQVRTRTLTNILDELNAPAVYDLLSIDVEGHDYEVLTSLDFTRYRPRVIVVEMHGFDLVNAENDRAVQFMRGHGFALVGHVATNTYFRDALSSQK